MQNRIQHKSSNQDRSVLKNSTPRRCLTQEDLRLLAEIHGYFSSKADAFHKTPRGFSTDPANRFLWLFSGSTSSHLDPSCSLAVLAKRGWGQGSSPFLLRKLHCCAVRSAESQGQKESLWQWAGCTELWEDPCCSLSQDCALPINILEQSSSGSWDWNQGCSVGVIIKGLVITSHLYFPPTSTSLPTFHKGEKQLLEKGELWLWLLRDCQPVKISKAAKLQDSGLSSALNVLTGTSRSSRIVLAGRALPRSWSPTVRLRQGWPKIKAYHQEHYSNAS